MKYYSIGETAKLVGVSVKTLRYYDNVGLLKPAKISESGYRYYTSDEISTLYQILFYRELEFSIEQIKVILSSPDNDKLECLKKHQKLLLMKKAHIEQLIETINQTIKGEKTMNKKSNITINEIISMKQKYADEVVQKYGNTKEFLQSEQRENSRNDSQKELVLAEQEEIFDLFAFLAGKNSEPESEEVQEVVEKWLDFICQNYYDCSLEIFRGLGEMYVLDERFKDYLNRHGEGTAELMSKTIAYYCKK